MPITPNHIENRKLNVPPLSASAIGPSGPRLLSAALAAALLLLGIPQAVDAVLNLYADSDTPLSEPVESLSAASVMARVALLETADAWVGDPQARLRAGMLELRFAYVDKINAQPNLERLDHAIKDIEEGLARAPANAPAWAALAYAQAATGDTSGAKSALGTSILVGPYDPVVVLMRCDLGLRLWPILDKENRQLIDEQVRYAWDSQPEGLVELARRGGYVKIVALALAQDPAKLTAFLRALERSG